jgi:hypothetical protein
MKTILFTFFSLFAINTFAQKLPDVQTVSLAAPANIRIDGKYTEWNDTYAAENKRTDVFYSLANDDKNLYLVIKSATSAVASKIMLGGITFSINTQGKKREKDAISVTYPLVVRANRNQGGRNALGQGQNRVGGNQGGGQNRNQQTQQQRDSASLVQRKTALASIKEIKVSGFKDITDTLVSIYNEYGLKAVANFDQHGALVYELAIPLNLLGITAAEGSDFVYQIKVNGLNMMNFGGNNSGRGNNGGGENVVVGGGGGGNFGGGRAAGGFGGGNAGATNMQDLATPTDFWGKYTLLKK